MFKFILLTLYIDFIFKNGAGNTSVSELFIIKDAVFNP